MGRYCYLVVLAGFLAGCETLGLSSIPKATMAGLGATAGGVFGPVGAGIGGVVGSLGGELTVPSVQPPVSDFWSLLGEVVKIGGWGLVLIILVPLILGLFITPPGKRRDSQS